MTIKKLLITFLWLAPILWLGCTVQRPVVRGSPEIKENRNYYTEIKSIGYQGFQAEMNYDSQKGFMKIIFLNGSKSKIKIVDKKKLKALMRTSNGIPREFYFYNPKEFGRHYFSDISERVPHSYEPTDFLYIRKAWLKNPPSFTLKIWIPIKAITYQVEFEYLVQKGS